MNLKKRLIYSNTVTVIIPILITLITALLFIYIASGIFNRNVSYDNFKKLLLIKIELFDAEGSVLKQKPELLEDQEYQKYLSQRVSTLSGHLIITKNDNLLYSTKNVNKIDVAKSVEAGESKSLNKTVVIDNSAFYVEAASIKFKDNVPGKIIFLIPSSADMKFVEYFILLVLTVFIASFVAINLFTSYVFSKRILKPVSHLKDAAAEIRNGNLDYEITEDGDEEIKELCNDFEAMRLQLKNNVHEKLVYDDNRKMLVSSISHDLKTPITSIKGYVEGILDGVANTPEKLHEYLRTIYSKSQQIDGMIDDLLLYSKLDLNQIPFNFERTDIIEYFQYCVLESGPELAKSNIHIHLDNRLKDSGYVVIDRERMRRVIMNIIDNSRKYMNKQEGEIVIILRKTNSSILFEIKDNGIGISEKDINKIFDRFYRADSARSGTKGSGLGLAIAKQIVEGHKGKIWAVSHENEGTSIIISLGKIEGA